MADALVDGQPEVGRVHDEVVAAGLDRWRRELVGELVGQGVELLVPVVDVADEVLPTPADRRRDRAHRVEDTARVVDPVDLDHGLQADPLLQGGGAVGVRVELVLPAPGRRWR